MGRVYYATLTVPRPTDTNAYTAYDAWADSTSVPTVGGFLFTELAGKNGTITDVMIVSSNDPATLLQGELQLFDAAVTAINDNAAFALSDADSAKLVGSIPFTLSSTTKAAGGSGTNSAAHFIDYQVGFNCDHGLGLYFLVKVINAYTPASGETLKVRLKIREG